MILKNALVINRVLVCLLLFALIIGCDWLLPWAFLICRTLLICRDTASINDFTDLCRFVSFKCVSSYFFRRYGTQALSLKSFIQPIVALLSDPSEPVRNAAIQTLVEVYKHVGKCSFCLNLYYKLMFGCSDIIIMIIFAFR